MTSVPDFSPGILYCYGHSFIRGNHSFSIQLRVAIKENNNFETNFSLFKMKESRLNDEFLG